MTHEHTYYRASHLAPYLLESHVAETSELLPRKNNHGKNNNAKATGDFTTPDESAVVEGRSTSAKSLLLPQEADAAGGGSFQRRVNSFSSLLLAARHTNAAAASAQDAVDNGAENDPQRQQQSARINFTFTPDWRLRDRMKTVGVGLVVALNVGTDPPDVVKPHPCAVLQCWMDPSKFSRAKAKEMIGERLEQQYAKWQLTARKNTLKYRRALDPSVEDVRNLCLRLRNQAKSERVLFHYNGHGVPRPTSHGEFWVFDKNHTEYIPLSIADVKLWLGTPSIAVLDCSSAGTLIPFFTATAGDDPSTASTAENSTAASNVSAPPVLPEGLSMDEQASQWVRDTIILCPCSEGEYLPMHPGINFVGLETTRILHRKHRPNSLANCHTLLILLFSLFRQLILLISLLLVSPHPSKWHCDGLSTATLQPWMA
jgi:Raptor N-terminal CASPase like domain